MGGLDVNNRSKSFQYVLFVACLILLMPISQIRAEEIPSVSRLGDGPIIAPNMDGRMGGNVQGPSLIRVPEWIENPLGKYYLYFADHRGTYIRLAYADNLLGPWKTHEPGSLQIEESFFPTTVEAGASARANAHIASPDVHIDHASRRINMYSTAPTLQVAEAKAVRNRLV